MSALAPDEPGRRVGTDDDEIARRQAVGADVKDEDIDGQSFCDMDTDVTVVDDSH